MTIALPLIIDDNPSSTGFVAAQFSGRLFVATTLHQLGTAKKFQAAVPPHGGDVSGRQVYPLTRIPLIELDYVIGDPILDLAVLITREVQIPPPTPRFITSGQSLATGDDALVLGYPFAPMGSFLETVTQTNVTSLGIRAIAGVPFVREFTVNTHAHVGLSGSPIIRKMDGVVCGVFRGCIAPPSMMSFGSFSYGNDSSVSICVSAEYILPLVQQAIRSL